MDAPRVNCVFVCMTDPLYAEYLGCDAVHQNVLDCRTVWNWLVQIEVVEIHKHNTQEEVQQQTNTLL